MYSWRRPTNLQIYDVVREGEAASVSLIARPVVGAASDGGVALAAIHERKDIVIENILYAVVLVKTRAFGVEGDVVLDPDPATRLVGVVAPTTVPKGAHVVTYVIGNFCAKIHSEVVHAAHVTKRA